MKKITKRIIVSTLIAFLIGTQMSAVTMAAPAAPTTAPSAVPSALKNLQYNVNQELKLPGATTGTDDQQPKKYFTDTANAPIINFVLSVIDFATKIIGTIAMIIFIIAGFMFMVAQGDQTKVDKAKEIFKYAIYGLVITFMSYLITIFVQSLFITTT